jgi:predicted aconitase with swiveling domain
MRRGRVHRREDFRMSKGVYFAAAGMGQKVRGRALVAKDGFSARYDLDRIAGTFSRPQHKLAGENYVGRVLVLDAAKGGVATAWMLYEMKARGVVPAALVLNAVNPIMVQGAALADFTMISGFDLDITRAITNGAEVEVDPTGERPCIRVLMP